jgi:hypothetical protein
LAEGPEKSPAHALAIGKPRLARHNIDRVTALFHHQPRRLDTQMLNRLGGRLSNLSKEIVMSTEDMVDAALAGLAQGEFVTIPALPDNADWDAFERARNALAPNLSRAQPAGRSLAAPKQPFDVAELEFDIGRAAVIALSGIGRLLHLAQERVHFLRA